MSAFPGPPALLALPLAAFALLTGCSTKERPTADPGVVYTPGPGSSSGTTVGGGEITVVGDGGACSALTATQVVVATVRPPPRPDGKGGPLLEGSYRVVSVGEYTSGYPTIDQSNERIKFTAGAYEDAIGGSTASGTYIAANSDAGASAVIDFTQTCPYPATASMQYTMNGDELLLYPTSTREVVYRRE